MQPLVSVITPSYNQGKFIEQTILSVLNQDYVNIEYIIIDGGSTDNTFKIVEKYKDKLTFISEPDEGQSDAINKGFKMAKGEIIAWLNSDDTYESGAVKVAVDRFTANADVALVYGEGDIIDEAGKKIKRFEATQTFDLWTLIHVWDYIMQPTTFFKKASLEDIGYLNKDLNWCMDWDLWIRIASKYEVSYVDKVLANSREYAETKTSTGGWKRFKELVTLMRRYGSMKYPPGYFLYCGSTIVTEAEKIPVFNIISRRLAYIIHKRVFSKLPIRYKDGWIGERLYLSIPQNYEEVIIETETIFEKVLPIKIKAIADGKTIYSNNIQKKGTNLLDIDLPKNDKVTLLRILLYANQFIVPNKEDRNNFDKRKLSINIKSIKIKK